MTVTPGASPRPNSPSSQHDFYEALDLVKPICPPRTILQLELLRELVVERRGVTRVLDLGCGEGRQAILASEVVRPGVVIGMDVSHNALLRAREKRVAALQAAIDERDLPFPSETFDVVVFSEVVEHLVDTDHAVAEIMRVLVPGGTMLLSTPNLAAWFNRLMLLLGFQPIFSEVSRHGVFGRPGTQVAGHLRLFTHRALREFLTASGWENVSLRGAAYHALPPGLSLIDRQLTHVPAMAAILVASARKPGRFRPLAR